MIGVRAAQPSGGPAPDAAFAERMAGLAAAVGQAVEADVAAMVAAPAADPLDASVVPAVAAATLVATHGLDSTVELALLALPVARALARPPISGYEVAAIGIEAGSGDLVLGANLEFPGADLGATIHAEGFVALRARRRRRALATLVVRQASPCAHCRQTLAEFSSATELVVVDSGGYALTLADLYPWPFEPAALGVDPDAPGHVAWPKLEFVAPAPPAPPAETAAALLEQGARAHAPYSRAPSAAVLRLRDGRIVGAGCVENVAFNPSISALQAALVELAAARVDASDISQGWLGCLEAGRVNPEPGFRSLLAAVAPEADARVARWRSA